MCRQNHSFDAAFTSGIDDPHERQHVVEKLLVSVEGGKKTEGRIMKYSDKEG